MTESSSTQHFYGSIQEPVVAANGGDGNGEAAPLLVPAMDLEQEVVAARSLLRRREGLMALSKLLLVALCFWMVRVHTVHDHAQPDSTSLRGTTTEENLYYRTSDGNGNLLYGYLAVIVTCLAFGSFAIPIKTKAMQQIDVDPLVLQTYKIGMTFLTSWLVLICGVPFSFTPYGFLTGLFMVPGGTAGYFAVRNAGLAVSQGVWASLKVLVAFAWGLLIFGEQVQSLVGTALSVVMMLVGLVGMSYYAHEKPSHRRPAGVTKRVDVDYDDCRKQGDSQTRPSTVTLGLSNHSLGVLAAVFDGIYGGSLLVPMHYADPAKTKGLSFVLSFSIGCTAVVIATWILRYVYCCLQTGSLSKGWRRLPSFYFTTIGPSASLAGLIWSIGNAGSILSVAILGQGLGYSIIQSQLLVAGLFGVFYFREIQGPWTIAKWFLSACLTVLGIVLLSREHVSGHAVLIPTDRAMQ